MYKSEILDLLKRAFSDAKLSEKVTEADLDAVAVNMENEIVTAIDDARDQGRDESRDDMWHREDMAREEGRDEGYREGYDAGRADGEIA